MRDFWKNIIEFSLIGCVVVSAMLLVTPPV
jgi:hypothetical protein